MRYVTNDHKDYHLIDGVSYEFEHLYDTLIGHLKVTIPIHRGKWQSQDVSESSGHSTHELKHVLMSYDAPATSESAQACLRPDLPWAEDHFQERVSGKPLNPPPSYVNWPHHRGNEDKHIHQGQFSHTYPERIWPKFAGDPRHDSEGDHDHSVRDGIRYHYGDLADVVRLLQADRFTRQAYLPLWFPEDTGATQGQRVPCTLGYHFIRNGFNLDCNYFIRSCDVYRHFRNDIYMAVRLMQWVVDRLHTREHPDLLVVGRLNMTISNLHLFQGDVWRT